MRIAFQGAPGAFSHLAARQHDPRAVAQPHVDFAAADGGFVGLAGEFFLCGGEPGLHLLGLFHEFGDVHGSVVFQLETILPSNFSRADWMSGSW